MIPIIIGLIVVLIIFVVVVNAIQQHKEKVESDKRNRMAVQKAIIDETEDLIMNMAQIPTNHTILSIMNKRCLKAAKNMKKIMPETKGIKARVQEYEARYNASKEMSKASTSEDNFILPEDETALVGILQCIKKIRIMLKSEQSKGALDPQLFMQEDGKLDAMQLKINIESLLKRGNMAYNKEMLGSARQYYEKALQSLASHSSSNEYVRVKKEEIEDRLSTIVNQLKSTNEQDREKKAKNEENELDLLFQPKKKW